MTEIVNGEGWKIPNKLVADQEEDFLYHIGYSKKDDLPKLFGDIKFVCMGGSASRMREFAEFLKEELKGIVDMQEELTDLCSTDRYAMYKVGPVLSVNHGIGMPSMSVLLHETMKLLDHAKCTDVVMIRIGTSGGVGVEAGTVIVTETAFNEMFQPQYHLPVLGKMKIRDTELNKELADKLLKCKKDEDNFEVIKAKTMSTSDFYEGQGRLDGAVCEYTEVEKMDYLRKAAEAGIRNIEMEATCFAAMCNMVGIPGAVVCVTLLNRLEGDQVTSPKAKLKNFEKHPQIIVSRYIKNKLSL